MDQDFLDNVKQIFNLLEISYTIFSDKEHIYIDNQDFYNHKRPCFEKKAQERTL